MDTASTAMIMIRLMRMMAESRGIQKMRKAA